MPCIAPNVHYLSLYGENICHSSCRSHRWWDPGSLSDCLEKSFLTKLGLLYEEERISTNIV